MRVEALSVEAQNGVVADPVLDKSTHGIAENVTGR